MAGIYVHIPFCKKACNYCDFHFTTSLNKVDDLTNAIAKEIELKKDRISAPIETIYFGGGTPSILSKENLEKIFDSIYKNFKVVEDAEITLEANPDDLTKTKIIELKSLPINRFSIGVQSFFAEDLLWMNRAHNEQEAEACIKIAQDAGFDNISVDLIFGYPLLTDEKLKSNTQKAVDFNIPHISAYSLTVEEKTALAHAIKKNKQQSLNDEQSAQQFMFLSNFLTENGYDHYEISNYGKPGKHAVHNTNYWRNKPYLGIGPSAHGFNGKTRYFNIANNTKYLDGVESGILNEDFEKLSFADRFNEYVMTRLRTMWGINLAEVESIFGQKYSELINKEIEPFLKEKQVSLSNNSIKLTQEGKLFADGIAASLFIDD